MQIYSLTTTKHGTVENDKKILNQFDERLQKFIKQMCLPIFRSSSLPEFIGLTCNADDVCDFFIKFLNTNLKELEKKQYDQDIAWANSKVPFDNLFIIYFKNDFILGSHVVFYVHNFSNFHDRFNSCQ